MIQSNELRIGNILQDTLTKEYLKVNEIHEDGGVGFFVINRDKFPLPEGWRDSPVPITPEILENLGFKRDGSYYNHRNISLPVCPTIHGTEIMLVPNEKYAFRIKYLHQLQNLYFALTGEELTFKP